ncbi:MAG TPA: hypothetical protein VFB72_06445, partial [Verrucomicrobiae bacterium]|nr:hypothetical protein [Verrucomicrobiae bacterium]
MIPIKIQCGCGQRYAFDVEPAQGQMPYTVACPSCGLDGTQAANDFIAQTVTQFATAPEQQYATAAAVIAPPAPPAAPPPARPSVRPGTGKKEIDIIQVTHEARAKTLWGDEKPAVIKFLMMQGLSTQEAQQLAEALFAERAKTVRANGVTKAITGAGLMCVPIAAFIGMSAIG